MKFFISVSLFFGISHGAFSMPCDSSYQCSSRTGRYQISLQSCRYRNQLRLLSTKINGTEITGSTLNQSWDGDAYLAFEIDLPTFDSKTVRILSIELSRYLKSGILREKFAESQPGHLNVVHREKITCQVGD